MFGLSKVFVRGIPIGLTLVALALAGGITSLQATPVCNNGTLPVGTGASFPIADLGPGVCVASDDALFGNFNFGNFPTDTSATFASAALAGNVRNSITLTSTFDPGTTYNSSFDVMAIQEGEIISALSADITQTVGGPTTLAQTTNPTGTGSIDFSKTGNMVAGPFSVSFSQNVTDLSVDSIFMVGESDASAILDTIVEPFLPPVTTPEPAALELLGIALAGFGAFGLRRKA